MIRNRQEIPVTAAASLILILMASLLSFRQADASKIDRQALVTRHNFGFSDFLTQVPLGNGEFCFNADVTGLQTFGGNSMAHWGWHFFPLPSGWTKSMVPGTGTFQQGRNKGLDYIPAKDDAIRNWMYDNPHIFNLGRIQICDFSGKALTKDAVQSPLAFMNLWTGTQTSSFVCEGQPVSVETCVDPTLDAVVVRIQSELVYSGHLTVSLDFPYPTLGGSQWVGDFTRIKDNSTDFSKVGANQFDFERRMDDTRYDTRLRVTAGSNLAVDTGGGPPRYILSARGQYTLEFVCQFSANQINVEPPSADSAFLAAAEHWKKYWTSGGAIDLSGSTDPRWFELERRIVLSQYEMAAQSAGSWPSAEDGLMGIDPWRGQFHMEMFWWHLAHYALWGRWDMAVRALACYKRFEPQAQALAKQLDYKGLQWPKSVGPEGRSAPWVGNQTLLWKEPHPIFFAELDYRLHPTKVTLEKWKNIVFGTAEYMADYPTLNLKTGQYELIPVMPPSENGLTRDDVFDLAYWRWGLNQANIWRKRLGLPRNKKWDEICSHLAPLPTKDGVYIESPDWPDTYTKYNFSHPDPIGVFGMLPPTKGVDPGIAKATVEKVWKKWNWNNTWGWDFPWMAMSAARCGLPDIAIDALLKDSPRNQYDIRGVNTGGPCPYLPGNGGLLYAVAMMAAGWDGSPHRSAPGFPDNGRWVVRWEGLSPAP